MFLAQIWNRPIKNQIALLWIVHPTLGTTLLHTVVNLFEKHFITELLYKKRQIKLSHIANF